MAAALTAASPIRVGHAVAVTATGFTADGALVVTVDGSGLSASLPLDSSGDLDPNDLAWTPFHEGTYTLRVSDGTTQKTAQVQVFASA